MNDLIAHMIGLLFAIGFFASSLWYFMKIKRAADKIDSVADARVTKVLNLGLGPKGKHQFAITYDVLIDTPFEILVTPTYTPIDLGTLVTIYYDSTDHTNYYIPEKWKIDPRKKKATTTLILSSLFVIGCAVSLFI